MLVLPPARTALSAALGSEAEPLWNHALKIPLSGAIEPVAGTRVVAHCTPSWCPVHALPWPAVTAAFDSGPSDTLEIDVSPVWLRVRPDETG